MSTWIFLRGLTRESRHWGGFAETFRQEITDADVHTVDLPGNGLLHTRRSPLQVTEMVDSCRAQLLRQHTPPPYHVLAMSLGAMVTVAWAERYPDEICGCVLVNTSLRPFSPFYRRLRPASYFPLLHCLLPGSSAHDWESTILRLTSRKYEQSGEILNAWVDYRSEHPVSARNAFRQLLAAVRYRAPLAKPLPPILVLASQNDALVDPRCSRQIVQRWSTAFAEHPTAGHDLPLDDGCWVARQVRCWLQTSAARSSVTPR